MLRDLCQLFQMPTLTVAHAILGMELHTWADGTHTSGRIVEVEAYGPSGDAACHAARGRTERNQAMYLEAGRCYVYFIYGCHYCVNVVTERPGIAAAVLVRALEPLDGVETMRSRRGAVDQRSLTNGPGKLCRALGIDRRFNGEDLTASSLIQLRPNIAPPSSSVRCTPRIGISKSKDLLWRFYVQESPFVTHSRETSP